MPSAEELWKQLQAEKAQSAEVPAAPPVAAPAPRPAPVPVAKTPQPEAKPAPAEKRRVEPSARKAPAPVAPQASTQRPVAKPYEEAFGPPTRAEDLASRQEDVRAEEERAKARHAATQAAGGGGPRSALEKVSDAGSALGATLSPAVAQIPRLLGPSHEESAKRIEGEEFQARSEGEAAKAEARRAAAQARWDALYGKDPQKQAAKALAETLQRETTTNKQNANTKYLAARSQQILDERLEGLGGADKVTDDQAYAKLAKEAQDQAVGDLVALRTTGQWHIPFDPTEIGADPSWWRALMPRQELRADGSTVRTESLGEWFMSAPLSAVDTAALAAMQGIGGDIEDRAFFDRMRDNLQGRQDLLSYRIEQDPEMQADLSSGDPERVRKALTTLGPLAGLVLLTPDPTSPVVGAAQVVRRGGQMARYGGDLATDLKKAEGAAAKVAVLNAAGKKWDEADAVAKEALREQKRAAPVLAAAQEFQEGKSLAAVADDMEKTDPSVARLIRDEVAAYLHADPEVSAYLQSLGERASSAVPGSAPRAEFGADQQARLEELTRRMSAERDALRQAQAEYRADLEDADFGALPGELQVKLAGRKRGLDVLRAEHKRLLAQKQAAAGSAKFDDAYERASRLAMESLEAAASGETAPARTASQARGEAPGWRPEAPPEETLYGVSVSPGLAQRIADAPDEARLVEVLSRAPDEVKEAAARDLGFDSYEALRDAAKIDPAKSLQEAEGLSLKMEEIRGRLSEALDEQAALLVAPENAKQFEIVRKAQKEAAKELKDAETELRKASAVDVSLNDKIRTAEAAAAAEEAKAAEIVGEARARVEQAKAAAVSMDDAEIAKLTREIEHQAGDMDPVGFKNRGRLPTTANSLRMAEEALAAAQKALDEYRAADADWLARTAAEAELAAVQKKRMSGVKKAPLLAEAQKKLAAADAKVGKKARGYELAVEATAAKRDEWGAKLDKVRAYGRELKLKNEDKIAAIRARMKAQGPLPPDPKNAGKLAAAEKALADAEAKAKFAGQEKRAEVQRLMAERDAARVKANEAYEAAVARHEAAKKTHAEATAAYKAVPEPTVRPQEGVAWDERLARVRGKVQAREDALVDITTRLMSAQDAPRIRAGLAEAFSKGRPEASRVAAGLAEREAFMREQARLAARKEPPDPVVSLERDRSQLVRELDFIDEQTRAENARRTGLVVAQNALRNVADLFLPYSDVLERSLRPHLQDLARRLQGEMEEIGARLARAAAVATDSDARNERAISAVSADETWHFREAVRERQIPAKLVDVALSAYLQPGVVLSPDKSRRIAEALTKWAEDLDGTLPQLRETLLAATRTELGTTDPTKARLPQQGDVFFAQAVASAGAVRRAMLEVGVGATTPRGAAEIEAAFEDFHRVGGNPRASIGRQRLVRMVVNPEDYAPEGRPVRSTALRSEVSEPVQPAYEKARLPGRTPEQRAADAVRALDETTGELADAFAQEVYVPRAFRDAIDREIAATVATQKLSAEIDLDVSMTYWRQAAIVGVGLSRPGQAFLDFSGDVWQIATRSLWTATKTAARSVLTGALAVPGAAQIAQAADFFRRVDPGTSARDFDRVVSMLTLSPDVQRVLDMSDEPVGRSGNTGKNLGQIARERGLYENLVTAQVTRSVAMYGTRPVPRPLAVLTGAAQGAAAGAVAGGWTGAAVGAIGGALFGSTPLGRRLAASNHAALVDLANTISNRRRAALFVGLVESGMSPTEAVQEAVRIVGAMSREVSPTERRLITWWYPFYAWRKFNTRRAVRVMANPFMVKLLDELAAQGSLAANALMDDTDEFGFHFGPMQDEPDPEALDGLLAELRLEHADWTDEQIWQEAETRMDDLPRASERYERMVARLRAMPREEALRVIRDDEDPDARWLYGAYWAPDPVRGALPDWIQGRYVLWLDRARSQELRSYNRAGQGTASREGDEHRYFALPPDPNVDGLATAMLPIAAMLNAATSSQGSAGADLVGIALRDPHAMALIEVAGLVDPDGQQDTRVPEFVGKSLLEMGLGQFVVVKTPLGEAYDPADPQAPNRDRAYYIPAQHAAAMYIMHMVFGGALAAIQAGNYYEGFKGEQTRTPGGPDAVDDFGAYSWFFAGQPVRSVSPKLDAWLRSMEATERVEDATKKPAKTETSSVTEKQRVMSYLETQEGFDQKAAAAAQAVKSGQPVAPEVLDYLRVLYGRETSPAQAAGMSDLAVWQEFRKRP